MWLFNYNLNLVVNKFKKGFFKKSGHNNAGVITVFHKESGKFFKYICINFNLVNAYLVIILLINFDLWRSSFINLVCSFSGKFIYILNIYKNLIGDIIYIGVDLYFFWNFCCLFTFLLNILKDIKISLEVGLNIFENFNYDIFLFFNGNILLLKYIPIGYFICNFEYYPGKGLQFCRSAGTFARIISKNKAKVLLRLTSGFYIYVSLNCLATIGRISNLQYNLVNYLKAGSIRNLGIRPHVRGVAMNPIDHPHGGGEGKTSGGSVALTPWGKLTKGYPTVIQTNKRHSNIFNIIK